MFGGIRRLVGAIKVTETATEIVVDGIPADQIARDIRRLWSTDKINGFMFSRLTKNGFSFPKFFAPDVIYALKSISSDRYSWTRKSSLGRVIEEITENTWLKSIQVEHPKFLDRSHLNEIKFDLKSHQLDFLDHYEEYVPKYQLKGYLLSAAPGTGKTLTTIALALCVKADIVILIVPKNSLHRVWTAAFDGEVMKKKTPYWVSDSGLPYKGERFVIAHYEAIDKVLGFIGQHSHSNAFVAVDESHNFNEDTAARTNLFVELCKKVDAKNVIWSSGTPLKAMGYEVIPLLKTIDPFFNPDVEARFRKIFGLKAGRAIDILRNRIGLISFKVNKQAVTDNKPTTTTIHIKIPNGGDYTLDKIRGEMQAFIVERTAYYKEHMKRYVKIFNDAMSTHERTLQTSEQKKAFKTYRTYVEDIRKYYDPEAMKTEAAYCNAYETKQIIPTLTDKTQRDEFKDARSVYKYVHLKIMGEALGGVLGKKRAQCHVDLVKHIPFETIIPEAAKKTVIFTSFVEALKAADTVLKAKGFKPLLVYGETNANLSGIISDFEKNPDVNPLGATYQSLSTAVPLVMANQAIFVNMPFRDHELVQAKARIDRLGQDTPVHFVMILLDTGNEPNISTRSNEILAWSKEMVAAMMGDEVEDAGPTLNKFYNSVAQEAYHDGVNDFDVMFESLKEELFAE